jgi:hypothetical protein
VDLYLVHKMILPPELICMVKSSLTNHDLFFVELTCRYLFWCTVSNKEQQLRYCQLWNQSPSKIIFDFKKGRCCHCSHVCCWKYRCQYLSLEDVRSWDNYALRWVSEDGHLPVVRYLCENFLTVQDVRSGNNAALRGAALNCHLPVVQYLCEKFQLTIQDVRSSHTLWWTVVNGDLPLVEYLCETFSLTV